MTFTQEVFNFCNMFGPQQAREMALNQMHVQSKPKRAPPSTAPPLLCTDESPWAEMNYYTVFRCITTDCSAQAVVPYWGLTVFILSAFTCHLYFQFAFATNLSWPHWNVSMTFTLVKMVATRNHFILLSRFTWGNCSTRVIESSAVLTLCWYHNAVCQTWNIHTLTIYIVSFLISGFHSCEDYVDSVRRQCGMVDGHQCSRRT